jgi:acylglycerol lipase
MRARKTLQITSLVLSLLAATPAWSLDVIPPPPVVAQLMQADQADELHLTTKTAAHDTIPVMDWVDPKVPVKAAILCVHGCGLHKGSWTAFGERMAPLGYAIYAVDVRGFGSFAKMDDKGTRQIDFKGCLKDVEEALRYVRKVQPNVPIFIAGESMGGAISLRMTAIHPELVDGLISSVPAGDRYHMLSDGIKVAFHLFTSPSKTMSVEETIVDRSTVKTDLRERWKGDPMARFNLKPIELVQFQMFCDANKKFAKMITKTPVLVLQGEVDKLVKADSTKSITEMIASKDSQCVVVQGSEHLLLEENQFNDDIINVLLAWLEEHIKLGTQVKASASK